jgi:hypothetical protein
MKKSLFLTVFLSLLFVSTAVALEPGDTLWTRTYGGSDWDAAYSVQQTTDGGYIIGGTAQSFGPGPQGLYLVKTDASGDTTWSRTYGGSDWDYGNSARQTTDGGYVIGGSTWSFGTGYADFYLVKADASGDTTWTRTYARYSGSYMDEAFSIRQTTDGGYVLAGYTGPWPYDSYVVKTNASGDTIWTLTIDLMTDDEWIWSIEQTNDGGYIATGGFWTTADNYDYFLTKIDASGSIVWTQTYGGSDDEWANCVQQTSDGGYIVVGTSYSFGAGDADFWLVKTDASGDPLWTRTYGGSDYEEGSAVQQTNDGGYVIAGDTYSFGAGGSDFYLVKTDAFGDTLWTRTYGGTADDDWLNSVQQTDDGGYIMAGRTNSFGAGNYDFYVVKVAGEELPTVSVEIVPDDPPVTVPQGGSFGYTGTITNNTEDPQITDIWVMAVGPTKGVYGPFKEFYDFALNPGQSRSGHFNQRVHNRALLGFYNYIAYCGDYPSTVMDSSFFQVEVIQGQFTEAGEAGWVLTGSFLEGEFTDLPSEFALSGNYPNPFNASTVIEYQLPTSSSVKLEVYNLLGSKVATLANGEQQAGYKSVAWDASEVSSGVYFYKLSAGDYTATRRMMLVK